MELYIVFTWLNTTAFITLVMQRLFKCDHYSIDEDVVYNHNFEIDCGTDLSIFTACIYVAHRKPKGVIGVSGSHLSSTHGSTDCMLAEKEVAFLTREIPLCN